MKMIYKFKFQYLKIKFYWNRHALHLQCPWMLSSTAVELSSCDRGFMAQKNLKYLLSSLQQRHKNLPILVIDKEYTLNIFKEYNKEIPFEHNL